MKTRGLTSPRKLFSVTTPVSVPLKERKSASQYASFFWTMICRFAMEPVKISPTLAPGIPSWLMMRCLFPVVDHQLLYVAP
jgi:hypothetical protein